jgi:hypothetical protein
MPSLAFNLSLLFTFPGIVSKELPPVFGFPSFGINLDFQNRLIASFDIGGISYTVGEEGIVILSSSLGFGTELGRFQFMLGFTGTTAGISKLNIEDQSYTAAFLKVGYKLGNFRAGLNLPIYLLATERKLSILPVPLMYVSLSSKK